MIGTDGERERERERERVREIMLSARLDDNEDIFNFTTHTVN